MDKKSDNDSGSEASHSSLDEVYNYRTAATVVRVSGPGYAFSVEMSPGKIDSMFRSFTETINAAGAVSAGDLVEIFNKASGAAEKAARQTQQGPFVRPTRSASFGKKRKPKSRPPTKKPSMKTASPKPSKT